MQNWEYKVEINLDREGGAEHAENELDKLGLFGWELVSVVEVSTKSGGTNLAFFFKRPID